jgi:hypothetical protein
MTGFKEGASDSPFDESDDDDDDAHTDSTTTVTGAPETTPEPTESGDTDGLNDGSQGSTGGGETSIPWVLARDSVHAQRSARQVHLQDGTLARERELRNTVERDLNETVELTDLREAALLVAMDHPDEVADQLRKWGYDYKSATHK